MVDKNRLREIFEDRDARHPPAPSVGGGGTGINKDRLREIFGGSRNKKDLMRSESSEPEPVQPKGSGELIELTDGDIETIEDGRNVEGVSAQGGDVEVDVEVAEPPPVQESVKPPTGGSFFTPEDMAKLQAVISGKLLPDANEVKSSSPVSEGEGEREVKLSEEGEKLADMMRDKLQDLPDPFNKIELHGELDYSYLDKLKVIRPKCQDIALEVLKRFGAAVGEDKLRELELVVKEVANWLLDRNEALAAVFLVDILKSGRPGFSVVLDEDRMIDASRRLFNCGEVRSLGGGKSDFGELESELNSRWLSLYPKIGGGTATDIERKSIEKLKMLRFSQEAVRENFGVFLSEDRIARCLALLAFVRDKNDFIKIYPPDLLYFDANPDFKTKFIGLYRETVQRLKDKIHSGEVKLDTSDDKAVKDALRPYSDLAVQGRLGWGFDWKDLCRKLGVN